MAAMQGRHIPLVSPAFDALRNHCLVFDYKVWMAAYSYGYAPPPRLEVYLNPAVHAYSGSQIWTSNGTGEGHMKISLWARPRVVLYRVSFVGIIGDPDSTLIVIANVVLNEGSCEATACEEATCGDDTGCSSLSTDCKLLLHLSSDGNSSYKSEAYNSEACRYHALIHALL